jgi:hypothetical protein
MVKSWGLENRQDISSSRAFHYSSKFFGRDPSKSNTINSNSTSSSTLRAVGTINTCKVEGSRFYTSSLPRFNDTFPFSLKKAKQCTGMLNFFFTFNFTSFIVSISIKISFHCFSIYKVSSCNLYTLAMLIKLNSTSPHNEYPQLPLTQHELAMQMLLSTCLRRVA